MKPGIKAIILTGAVLLALPLSAIGAETALGEKAAEAKEQASQKMQDTAKEAVREQSDKQTMKVLEAKEDKQSVGEYVGDSAVTAKVKSKFLAQKGLDSLDIKVVTVDGIVTLMGNVDTADQAALAEKVAKEVGGVTKVDNKLVVKK